MHIFLYKTCDDDFADQYTDAVYNKYGNQKFLLYKICITELQNINIYDLIII